MMIIGCDFHPRFQQIAFVDEETGECGERALEPSRRSGAVLPVVGGCRVRIGMEATGNYRWFRCLMGELGHELLLGDASAIRASCARKQKTDKRDARHILSLLVEDRFPAVWQPPVWRTKNCAAAAAPCRSWYGCGTRVKNQLDAMAKNEGLLRTRVWSSKRRQGIEGLPLTGW